MPNSRKRGQSVVVQKLAIAAKRLSEGMPVVYALPYLTVLDRFYRILEYSEYRLRLFNYYIDENTYYICDSNLMK